MPVHTADAEDTELVAKREGTDTEKRAKGQRMPTEVKETVEAVRRTGRAGPTMSPKAPQAPRNS